MKFSFVCVCVCVCVCVWCVCVRVCVCVCVCVCVVYSLLDVPTYSNTRVVQDGGGARPYQKGA